MVGNLSMLKMIIIGIFNPRRIRALFVEFIVLVGRESVFKINQSIIHLEERIK